MSEEPIVMRKLRKMVGRGRDEDLQLTGGIPAALIELLNDHRHSVPVLIRKFQGAIEREHLKIDTEILEAHARKIQAGKNVLDAITALRTSAHEGSHLDAHLERGEELKEAEHQTSLLGEQAKQAEHRSKIDAQRTESAEQGYRRVRARKRTAAAKAKPIDKDFEQRARELMDEIDDVQTGYAQLEGEVRKRTDWTQSAKEATIEWLKDLAASELRRRLDEDEAQ